MNRREFFGNLFAAGVVAVAPYSVLSLVDEVGIVKNTIDKKFNFGSFQSFLIHDGSIVIAKSNHTSVIVKREIHRLPNVNPKFDSWYEYAPGPWSFKVTMGRVYEIAHLQNIREYLESGDELIVFFKAINGNKFEGDCRISGVDIIHDMNLGYYMDIDLVGNGAPIKISENGRIGL